MELESIFELRTKIKNMDTMDPQLMSGNKWVYTHTQFSKSHVNLQAHISCSPIN